MARGSWKRAPSKHLKNRKTTFSRTNLLESETLKVDQSQAERKGERTTARVVLYGTSMEEVVNVGSQSLMQKAHFGASSRNRLWGSRFRKQYPEHFQSGLHATVSRTYSKVRVTR